LLLDDCCINLQIKSACPSKEETRATKSPRHPCPIYKPTPSFLPPGKLIIRPVFYAADPYVLVLPAAE